MKNFTEILGRIFFSNFFSLLLLVVSGGQWAVLWWLAWPGATTPLVVHAAGVTAVYLVNRQITGGFGRRAARKTWRRFYDAYAFTSLGTSSNMPTSIKAGSINFKRRVRSRSRLR